MNWQTEHAFEREEEYLGETLSSGEISQEEYDRAMRELHRDCRDAMLEAAEQAYQNDLEGWQ